MVIEPIVSTEPMSRANWPPTSASRSTLLLAAVIAFSACSSSNPDGPSPSPSGDPETIAIADDDELHLPSAFSISRFTDFQAAGEALGFPVPTSEAFTLIWGDIIVQPSVDLGPDVPRKVMAVYDVEGNSVHVTLAPATFWREGALQDGVEATVGGFRGWLSEDEHDTWFFSEFATSDRFGSIWLVLQMPKTMGPETLARFLASLRSPQPIATD